MKNAFFVLQLILAVALVLTALDPGAFAATARSGFLAQASGAPQENRPDAAPAAQAAPTGEPAMDAASAPQTRSGEVTELWTGSLYTSTYRVGLCFSAQGTVRGVVHLRLHNGQVDVYHIVGSVSDNQVQASHSSGHSFKGRLLSHDRVEGVISLKNGMKIKLEGKRAHDVPLAAENCAPLEQ